MNEKLEKAASGHVDSITSRDHAFWDSFVAGYTRHANTVNPILKEALEALYLGLNHAETCEQRAKSVSEMHLADDSITKIRSSISAITELLKNEE